MQNNIISLERIPWDSLRFDIGVFVKLTYANLSMVPYGVYNCFDEIRVYGYWGCMVAKRKLKGIDGKTLQIVDLVA